MTEDEALAALARRRSPPGSEGGGRAVGDVGAVRAIPTSTRCCARESARWSGRSSAKPRPCFSRLIERAPAFAEGWNKRATVRYMAGDYEASIADCRETLARNPNHFGALSGQGLCHFALDQHREAAALFRAPWRCTRISPGPGATSPTARAQAAKSNGHGP